MRFVSTNQQWNVCEKIAPNQTPHAFVFCRCAEQKPTVTTWWKWFDISTLLSALSIEIITLTQPQQLFYGWQYKQAQKTTNAFAYRPTLNYLLKYLGQKTSVPHFHHVIHVLFFRSSLPFLYWRAGAKKKRIKYLFESHTERQTNRLKYCFENGIMMKICELLVDSAWKKGWTEDEWMPKKKRALKNRKKMLQTHNSGDDLSFVRPDPNKRSSREERRNKNQLRILLRQSAYSVRRHAQMRVT